MGRDKRVASYYEVRSFVCRSWLLVQVRGLFLVSRPRQGGGRSSFKFPELAVARKRSKRREVV